MQNAQIRDGGPVMRITSFLQRWMEAHRGKPAPPKDEGALHTGLKELLKKYEAEADKR